MTRVSVFMNVFDCHVNRSPVAGRITQIALHARPVPQRRARQGERGQRAQRPRHRDAAARKIGVVQIAGLVARRIVSFVKTGDGLTTGERFGLIRFGSRLDIYLPLSTPGPGRARADGDRRRDRAGGSRAPRSPARQFRGRHRAVHGAAPSLPLAAAAPRTSAMSDLFPPFAPDPRRTAQAAVQAGAVPGHRPQHHHADRALPRPDGDPAGLSRGGFEPAVIAIVAAAVLDGVDGRVARLLKGTSRFGAELDSLADFVNFGVTPGAHSLQLRSPRPEIARLDRRAGLRHRDGAAPRALQRDDGRSEPTGMAEGLLHRHARACRRGHVAAAALPVVSSAFP